MGIDKSLSDRYPSVIINGSRYHYGRVKASGEYLVEHESIALDSWAFEEKEDLQAFLINLPESAYPHLRFKLHPDWRAVSSEQRDAYAEQDRLLFRTMAAEKLKNGTAQPFNMDLEGEHGPHEPQRIESRSTEPPIERVERQLRDWKTHHSWEGGLSEAGKLRVLEGELDWNGVAAKDKEAVLAREVDFTRVPRDAQREWLGEVYHDAREDKAESRSSAMAESHEDRGRADRLAEFSAWIEEWRRKGAGSDGAKATEEEKLREIFWELCTVSHGFTVPEADVLAAIERNVDYAGLPAVQREMLEELRARLDAGQFDAPQPEHRDVVGLVLTQAVDAGFFEESLRIAKESQERPWAEIPEDRKVRRLIEMARDSGAWVDWDFDGTTPGTHVLDTIEREVDYAKLAPWRREGLERLREQVDRGELAGEKPFAADRSDRVGYALRTTELEAIVQDYRHSGDTAQRPVQLTWAELREEEKLDRLERAIGFLSLDGESRSVDTINREVDLARVPEDRRRVIESARAEAGPGAEGSEPTKASIESGQLTEPAESIDPRIGGDPLITAARLGDTRRIQQLLDDGWGVHSRGGWVGTPLHAAAETGQTDAARLLVDAGADLKAKRWGGSTPLLAAAQGGHAATVGLLIDRGADVNAGDNNNRTALHRAAEGGHVDIAGRLIEAGADINARDNTEARLTGGWTPFHVATAHGHTDLAERLVAAGADQRDEWVGAFAGRIYGLLRHGVDSRERGETIPWAEVPETEKLERIVGEAEIVSSRTGSSVPGAYTLMAIEMNIDYAGLPAAQREMLEDLRARLDAGQIGRVPRDHKDFVAMGLARIVGVAQFEWEEQSDKEKIGYQVWHDRGWPQSRLDQMLGGAPPSHFPQDYFHAADVRAGSLEEAVRLTTGTGHVLKGDHRPWDRNSDVRSYTPKPLVPRDTDAGDVIVDPQGKAHRYDGRGFGEIEAASRQHIPSPAELVERDGVVSQRQTDRQPADLLDGQGAPEQRQDRGHKPGPNHRPKA